MSFNRNDNKSLLISRDNYEEYFLLYTDNELTPAERLQVEQFVIAHPDLKPELELLLNTKLPLEQAHLENKESLLAENMKLIAIDEALLLYIDNELSGPEKLRVEEKLKHDKAYQLQYKSLLQTKPTDAETIIYPYKNELYHHDEKKRFSFYWMRIAAAIIVLLGMGIFFFTNQQTSVPPVAEVAKKTETGKESVPAQPATRDVTIATKPVLPTVRETSRQDEVPGVVRHVKKKPQEKEIRKQQIISLPANESEVVSHNGERKKEQQNIVINNKKELPPQQTINKPDVTTPSIASLNNQTTLPVTAEQRDVVKIDNEKKSTLKGFLRKATRFIERRTNITTTNENDELLIGAVALKL